MNPRVEQNFGVGVDEVIKARHFTRDALSAWGLASEDTALVVNELASNALRHSGGGFSVALRHLDDAVVVEVADASDTMPEVGRFDVHARRGRGLMIIDHLSCSWGVRAGPGTGKTVWAEIPIGDFDGSDER